ncbi:hypothetical protein [Ammoniphilus resinae]|uniref:Uncharacterized protein n=1 Tax=Ammoniphilus resinae TaxID=861532 RepID=A0ABS4GPU6_9BACL|nr:hypothetical protein [Ammoniphilus resinae]MBP1932289.1 hypothetical protein [Ammoniphilus resinae]
MKKDYYTIKDLENMAKKLDGTTFKGRANEFIHGLSKDFGIKFKKGLSVRRSEEYQFSEREKDLLLLLMKNKGLHPMDHKNTKKINVTLRQVSQYQRYLLKDIANLPDPLRVELAEDDRVQQMYDIQITFDSINQLDEKLELLFYMMSTDKGISFLKKWESHFKELEREGLNLIKESFIAEKRQEHKEKRKGEPTEEQVQKYAKKRIKDKLEKIEKGVDPEIHLLDHLLIQKLKEISEVSLVK